MRAKGAATFTLSVQQIPGHRHNADASPLTDARELKVLAKAALDDLPTLWAGAAAETRSVLERLIGQTVVKPSAGKCSVEIKKAGQLTGLLTIKALAQRKNSKLVNVVAGARFELATFGL